MESHHECGTRLSYRWFQNLDPELQAGPSRVFNTRAGSKGACRSLEYPHQYRHHRFQGYDYGSLRASAIALLRQTMEIEGKLLL